MDIDAQHIVQPLGFVLWSEHLISYSQFTLSLFISLPYHTPPPAPSTRSVFTVCAAGRWQCRVAICHSSRLQWKGQTPLTPPLGKEQGNEGKGEITMDSFTSKKSDHYRKKSKLQLGRLEDGPTQEWQRKAVIFLPKVWCLSLCFWLYMSTNKAISNNTDDFYNVISSAPVCTSSHYTNRIISLSVPWWNIPFGRDISPCTAANNWPVN